MLTKKMSGMGLPKLKRNLCWILLNQTKIKLYLSFSDWIGTKRNSVCSQINRRMVITIEICYRLTRVIKDFSACGLVTQIRLSGPRSFLHVINVQKKIKYIKKTVTLPLYVIVQKKKQYLNTSKRQCLFDWTPNSEYIWSTVACMKILAVPKLQAVWAC